MHKYCGITTLEHSSYYTGEPCAATLPARSRFWAGTTVSDTAGNLRARSPAGFEEGQGRISNVPAPWRPVIRAAASAG